MCSAWPEELGSSTVFFELRASSQIERIANVYAAEKEGQIAPI
jgi:hypothetical protein